MEQLRAGVYYPRSTGEFQAWFRTDEDCLDYLEWLRWPGGFICPRCGDGTGWRLGDGRFECAGCSSRTSVTAGTIFDRTRTPLTVWFTACWLFATQKDGISALSLQRSLEIGSYQTAWAMLGRLRSVLVRPGRDRLSGTVEVDETYIGGDEPGLRGGRAPGKKVLTGIAVEVREPKGIGRCRMAVLADGSSASLHPFVTGHVRPGATVITDAWMGYHGLAGLGPRPGVLPAAGTRRRSRPGPLPRPDRPPAIQGTARAARHPRSSAQPGAARREPVRGGQLRCSYGCPTPVKWIPPRPAMGYAHNRAMCAHSISWSARHIAEQIRRSASLRPPTMSHGWLLGGGGEVSVWTDCHASGAGTAERTAAGAAGLAQQRGGDQVVGAGAVAGDRDVPHHRDPDQGLDI